MPEQQAMKVVQVPIAKLVPDPDNKRKGNVPALVESLRKKGQHRAVVVQRSTNKIIIGNHMVEAAKILGWTKISVQHVDDTDEEARERSLSDNLIGDRAQWDEEGLRQQLLELGEGVKELPGVSDKQLRELLTEVVGEVPEGGPAMPLVPRPGESYDYICVVAETELDSLWLREVLGVGQMSSYKAKRVGQSRVISVDQLKQAINTAVERGTQYY